MVYEEILLKMILLIQNYNQFTLNQFEVTCSADRWQNLEQNKQDSRIIDQAL